MKLLFCSFLLLFLAACNDRVVPIKGMYQDTTYAFSAPASRKQVLNKLIDVFTAKGLAVKTLDEQNGIITTETTSFLQSYAWELKNGSLSDSNAYVICSRVRGPFTLTPSYKPEFVTGQWVVRLKDEENTTHVDVRLMNATGKVAVPGSSSAYDPAPEMYNVVVKSTGIFEKAIADALK